MKLQLVKGTQDSYYARERRRAKVIEIITRAYERYGYGPLRTPMLNHWEVLASKYAGGAEILQETYGLTNRGDEHLGLRYDLTIPFARVIGMYSDDNTPEDVKIRLPFKRYEVGTVFRDGPRKVGRLREFLQCDADVVGSKSLVCEAELIALAFEVFDAIFNPENGAVIPASQTLHHLQRPRIRCRLNDRKLLSGILQNVGIPEKSVIPAILALDKIGKKDAPEIRKEIMEAGVPEASAQRAMNATNFASPTFNILQLEEHLDYCQIPKTGLVAEGLDNLRKLHDLLDEIDRPLSGMRSLHLLIDPCLNLARGLEIYTGTVWEFFPHDSNLFSSALAAGGRYDKVISAFVEDDPELAISGTRPSEYPAVGHSFGVDAICAFLEKLEEESKASIAMAASPADILISAVGGENAGALRVANALRNLADGAGLKVDLFPGKKKLAKVFDYAEKLGIAWVGLVGGDEVADPSNLKLSLKQVIAAEGEEKFRETMPLADAAAKVRE